MTIRDRVFIVIGLACGFALASIWCKRRKVHPAQPVDSDRFNMAGLDDRMKQYDREFRLEGYKHE